MTREAALALIAAAIATPPQAEDEFTVAELAQVSGVNEQTTRRRLAALLKAGSVTQRAFGKGALWRWVAQPI